MSRLGLPAALLVVLVSAASPAHAHATLVASSPADGATLAEAPAEVVLEFSEEMVAPASVVVTSPTGAPLVEGAAEVDGVRVVQPLRPSDEPGTYTLAFRVYSVDGHPVTGQQTYVVGEPSATRGPTDRPTSNMRDEAAPTDEPDAGWDTTDTQVTGAIVLFGTAAALYLLSRRGGVRRPGR